MATLHHGHTASEITAHCLDPQSLRTTPAEAAEKRMNAFGVCSTHTGFALPGVAFVGPCGSGRFGRVLQLENHSCDTLSQQFRKQLSLTGFGLLRLLLPPPLVLPGSCCCPPLMVACRCARHCCRVAARTDSWSRSTVSWFSRASRSAMRWLVSFCLACTKHDRARQDT